MKKLLLIIIVNCTFLIVNCFSQQYGWTVISPDIPGTPSFSDVFFISDNEGWITTNSSSNIYKTVDGTASFSTQTTPLGGTSAIHMLDASNGYSGGAGGWVYKTTDGGSNWNILASMGTLIDISFPPGTDPNSPIGYACGSSGRVWEITSTLTNLNSGSSSDFNGISAPSVNNVWVCGGNRIYYYNGTNFTSQIAPPGTFNDIHFINNQEGWVVGDGGVVGHTTDGGAGWATQTIPDIQNRSLYGVFFLDSNNGWAVGNGGIILHTTNGGTNWLIEGEGLTTAFLRGVQFTSPTNGYVVGNEKTLYKYTQITSVEDEKVQPSVFRLEQNYPNPFNPSTTISWQSSVGSHQTIKVFDVLGNEIATLVDEYRPAGSYEVVFDGHSDKGQNLPSGVYFYQLRIRGPEINSPQGQAGQGMIQTKKMILIK